MYMLPHATLPLPRCGEHGLGLPYNRGARQVHLFPRRVPTETNESEKRSRGGREVSRITGTRYEGTYDRRNLRRLRQFLAQLCSSERRNCPCVHSKPHKKKKQRARIVRTAYTSPRTKTSSRASHRSPTSRQHRPCPPTRIKGSFTSSEGVLPLCPPGLLTAPSNRKTESAEPRRLVHSHRLQHPRHRRPTGVARGACRRGHRLRQLRG